MNPEAFAIPERTVLCVLSVPLQNCHKRKHESVCDLQGLASPVSKAELVALTRYAPTVPWASMRAHSDIKNILIFEKHDEFLRRPSPSSASPALRSGSRCFFTCILRHFLPTQHCERAKHTQDSVRMKTHTRFTLPHLLLTAIAVTLSSQRRVCAIYSAALAPDKLRDAHPNSAGLRRSSASKHCLPAANT